MKVTKKEREYDNIHLQTHFYHKQIVTELLNYQSLLCYYLLEFSIALFIWVELVLFVYGKKQISDPT